MCNSLCPGVTRVRPRGVRLGIRRKWDDTVQRHDLQNCVINGGEFKPEEANTSDRETTIQWFYVPTIPVHSSHLTSTPSTTVHAGYLPAYLAHVITCSTVTYRAICGLQCKHQLETLHIAGNQLSFELGSLHQ